MDTDARAPDASPPPAADPPLWEALTHLQLNIAQTAALCGISVRQLGYWTKQGYVSAAGQGERRLYGLDAVRRILNIRRAMAEGASLRQALRVAHEAERTPRWEAQSATGTTLLSYDGGSAAHPLPPSEEAELDRQLLTLFGTERGVRDDAPGLALKLGRATGDVRRAAEALCARGVLARSDGRGEPVFRRAGEGA